MMAGRARTGKRWMLTIGDCEQSTAHATSVGLRSLKELSHDCLVCLKPYKHIGISENPDLNYKLCVWLSTTRKENDNIWANL